MNQIVLQAPNECSKAQKGRNVMNSRSEVIPIPVAVVSTSKWGPRLFRFAYLCAIGVAMTGWSIALGWGSFSLLRWFL